MIGTLDMVGVTCTIKDMNPGLPAVCCDGLVTCQDVGDFHLQKSYGNRSTLFEFLTGRGCGCDCCA